MTRGRSAWRGTRRSRRRVATLASVALLLHPFTERFPGSRANAPTDPVAHAVVRIFDVSAVETGGPCACDPYGATTGPLKVSASMEELRGRRALLSFAAYGTGYLGMNEYAIALRRVRLIGDPRPRGPMPTRRGVP